MASTPPTSADLFLAQAVNGLARVFGLELAALTDWQRFFFHLACVICLLNIGGSVHDFFHYGGTDLRARVIGARALLAGLDPYSLTSTPELPETLQDPHQKYAGVARCTYPPSLLLVYATGSPLPYPVQRGLWMLLEWLALLTSVAVLARTIRAQPARLLFVVTALVFVAGSYFWRLHVVRGQYYVFIGLLLAWGMRLVLCRGPERWEAGLFFGAALALRLPAVLVLVPLWLVGRRRTVTAALGTSVAILAVTLPFAGLGGWSQFAWLAGEYERDGIDPEYLKRTYQPLDQQSEPVDGFLPESLDSLSVSLTVSNLGPLFKRIEGWLPAERVPLLIRAALLALVMGLSRLFLVAHRKRPFSPRLALLAGVMLMLLADYFLPARIGYVDVLYCLPLALVMPALARPSNRFWYGLLCVAFLLSVVPVAPASEAWWKLATLARSLVLLGLTAGPLYGAVRARLVARSVRPMAG